MHVDRETKKAKLLCLEGMSNQMWQTKHKLIRFFEKIPRKCLVSRCRLRKHSLKVLGSFSTKNKKLFQKWHFSECVVIDETQKLHVDQSNIFHCLYNTIILKYITYQRKPDLIHAFLQSVDILLILRKFGWFGSKNEM